MAISAGVTETVFPAAGKGMPDVISYLDEVPWSTAVDVKPMQKSVMTESYTWPDYLPSGLYNPTTPYLFFSTIGWDDVLGVGMNATDLIVYTALATYMRPIVYMNGPVTLPPLSPPGRDNQISQQLSPSLGPFVMIDDEIIRYENPLDTLIDTFLGPFDYYPAFQTDLTIPSISERGMFGTTPASHLIGATIKELIVGYITGIEYSSSSEMVTIRTNIVEEFWAAETGYYYPFPNQWQVPYLYSTQAIAEQRPYAFSVPRKQISAMGLGQ
jgi:hypothetical protein